MTATPLAPAPPRRRSGWIRVLLVLGVVVAVLVAGVLIANTVGKRYVEQQIQSMLVEQYGLTQPPQVEITDSNFALSYLRGRMDQVTISVDGLPLDINNTTINPTMVVTLTEVTFAQPDTYRAGGLAGTVTANWADVSAISGYQVTPTDSGRIQTEVSYKIFAATVSVVLEATPQITDAGKTLVLSDPSATVAGVAVPDSVSRPIIEQVIKPIPLTLPAGITATSVNATEPGLVFQVSGQDIDLTGLG